MRLFKISCHAISEIMAGTVGLTDKQALRLDELQTRRFDAEKGVKGVKPLTNNMEEELADLIHKRDNPELPTGAQTYVKTWMKEKLFNRKKEWKALVVEKGLACEPMSISLLGKILEQDLQKNDEFFENEHAHGFPDIVTGDIVRDIKSSWDLFTFPMFDKELTKQEYWWQLQGYMWLTGLKKAALDYVLIDTPMPLVELDLKKLYYQSGGRAEDWNPEQHELLLPNYRFDDIPEKLRVKTYLFDFDHTVPQQIKDRVELCRKFIHSALPEVLKEEQQAA